MRLLVIPVHVPAPRVVLRAFAVFIVVARAAAAQTPGGKFWASIIPGYGFAKTNGAQGVTPPGNYNYGSGYGPYGAIGLTVPLGAPLYPWVRLGASLRSASQVTTDWVGEPSPVVHHFQAFAAVHLPLLRWQHPSPVILGVAFGPARYNETYYSGGCASGPSGAYCWKTVQAIDTRDGWGTAVSLGYMAPVGHELYVMPLLRYELCHVGARSTDAASPAPEFAEHVVEFGFGLSYR